MYISISQLRSVTCHMGSHSVTCHPTQANTSLHPSQTGWYSIYRPRVEGWVSPGPGCKEQLAQHSAGFNTKLFLKIPTY